MLDRKGFDLWANDYDKAVGLSDESQTYPFAGYQKVLASIYERILSSGAHTILDIGFGTATLTAKLYEHGCAVWGQDFSSEMIRLARVKMPEAQLFQGDFTLGLAADLKVWTYDAIIATYSLHHLPSDAQIPFLQELLSLLAPGGRIYIGDIAFETRAQLEECRAQCGEEWDEDECYLIYNALKPHFPYSTFEPYSICAGVITLRNG